MDKSKIWHYVVVGFAVAGAALPVLLGMPKMSAVAAVILAAERLFQAVKPIVDEEVSK